jgi:tetratricopeptide (TPR) repeat protein
MPALLELLDQYFFADVPGMQARTVLVHGWEHASNISWETLYVQALEDALTEELPHLSAYIGQNSTYPSREELAHALTTDLGDAGNALRTRDLHSGAFLTELARTMQSQRLILVNQHNLFTDEYRQILLNLFDYANAHFKSAIANNQEQFAAALEQASQHDSILTASIANFLTRQFGITLESWPAAPPPPQPMTEMRPAHFAFSDARTEAMPNAETETPAPQPASEPKLEKPSQPPDSAPLAPVAPPENLQTSPPPPLPTRVGQNRLRVLIATPSDVLSERALLVKLIQDLDARARARFGLQLEIVNPSEADLAGVKSAVELADIFIGAVWLHFGAAPIEQNPATGETFFAGAETDFTFALEQGSAHHAVWLRTVIYRSIRPPLDLLHLNVAEYTRVQQFFERASAFAEDLVRVYNDAAELAADAQARLDAWIYNYAGDLANALTEYGKTSAAAGQLSDALSDFEQALSLYRELDRPEQELALWLQMAALYRQSQQPAPAAHALDAALRLARLTEDDNAAATALHQIGLLAADAQDWRGARRAFQQARAYLAPDAALYRTILADEISAHENLGDAFHATHENVPARDAYRDALALAQEMDDAPRTARLWQKLGALADERGEWAEALDAYKRALTNLDANAPGETRTALFDAQAHAQWQLALAARAADDAEGAERALRAALDLNAQGSRSRARRVEILTALGALAAARGIWEQAIDAYARAQQELTAPDDAAQRTALMNEQAAAYQHWGDARLTAHDLENAGSAYREAFALYQELDARAAQGVVLHQLGMVASAQARWQEANAYFTQAIGRLDTSDASSTRAAAQAAQANALEHIGDAHQDAQEWGQAEIAYLQARGNLEQIGMGGATGALLTKLGIVTAAQGRRQEALAFFQQARARLTAPEQAALRAEALRHEANTLHQIADARRGAGDFTQAAAAYRQQLDLAQELGDAALEGDALHHLGLVAADQAQWDDALSYYEQAFARLQDPAQAETRALIQHHQLAAYEKLGERERAAHLLPQAEMAYRSALTFAQALNEREREADILYALGLLSIEQENWDEALFDLRRALGIYNLMERAPNKPQVIWNIGRAQRGSKRKQMQEALHRAETLRDENDLSNAVTAFGTALQFARDLGDAQTESRALEALGDAAAAQADWDTAIAQYRAAIEKLAPDEAERRTRLTRAQVDALRQRSERARLAQNWSDADADLANALEFTREWDDRALAGDIIYHRGLVAAGQAHWNDAIDLYSTALANFDETNPQRADIERAQAEAYQALGDSEYNAQNWEGAQAAYSQALALQNALGNRPVQVTLLAALGDVAARQARWGDAVAHLSQAHAMESELQGTRVETLAQELARATLASKREQQADAEIRGDTARAARDFKTAEAEYAHALALAEELQDRSAQAELHAKLGFVQTEQGDFENALAHYRGAAGLYDAPEQASQRSALIELQAQTLQELGNRAGETGRWNDALGFYQQAIALLDAPEQAEPRSVVVRLAAVTLQNLGDQARANENWDSALDAYRRAAGMFGLLHATSEQQVVWAREATVVANLARQARSRGEYDSALRQYADAQTLFSRARDATGLNLVQRERVSALGEAGDAFAAHAQWQLATNAYQDAYALAQELGDRAAQADMLYRLGQIQAEQAQWDTVLAYTHAALALTEGAEMPALRAKLLNAQRNAARALADLKRVSGDLENAEAHYNTALSAALEQNDRAAAGELYFILGTLAADSGAWDKALGNYALALENVEPAHRDDVKSYQAVAFQHWGDAQRTAGQFDAAASAYTSALERAQELQDSTRAANVLYRFGLLNATLGHWEPALDYYRQAEAHLTEEDADLRAALANDNALAVRAFKRSQLDTQLAHAEAARQELQWDDAATAFRAVLSLAQDLDDTAEHDRAARALVKVYASKGATLKNLELWDEASDAYRESWQLARDYHLPEEVQARQNDMLSLGMERINAYRAAGDWANAERAAQATVALAQEFGDTHAHADALYLLGTLAAQQTHWDAALAYYDQARPLLVAAERSEALVQLDHDRTAAADILQRQAQLAHTRTTAAAAAQAREWDTAEQAYRTALALARGLDDASSTNEIAAHLVALTNDHAAALRAANDWDNAETAYRHALAVAHEFDDADAVKAREQDLIALPVERANALRAQQDWDNAETAYRHALAVAHEFDDADAVQARQRDLVALALEKTQALRNAGDWTNAERAAVAQLQVAQEFQDTSAQGRAYFALGAIAAAMQKWQSALDNYAHAAELLTEPEDAGLVAEIGAENVRVTRALKSEQCADARARGDAAVQTQDWHTAEQAYQDALALARELGDTRGEGEIQTARADVAAAETRWTDAAALYAQAAACFTLPEDATIRANLLRRQLSAWTAAGDSNAQQQDWHTALEHYAFALDTAHQLDARSESIALLRHMGHVATQQQDLRGALGYYDNALAVLGGESGNERIQILTSQADIWQQLGDVERNAHNLEHAQVAYEHALELETTLARTPERGAVLHRLGLVYSARAQWDAALQAHQQAYEILRDAPAPETRAEILTAIGAAQQHLGNFEAARASYAQALALRGEHDYAQRAPLETALGDISFAQTHWQDAIAHYAAASAAYAALGDEAQARALRDKTATGYHQLGDLLYGEGNWQDAAAAYQNALEFDRANARTDRDADLWYRLARTDAAQERYDDAITHYEAALAAIDESELALRDRILAHLAFALQQRGKRALAEDDWARAETLLARALPLAEASDNFDQAADVALALGHTFAAQEKETDALRAYRRALDLDQRDGSAFRAQEINQALANCLLAMAHRALEQGDSETARIHLNEAAPYAERANNPLLLGQVLETLGEAEHAPEQALEYYAQAARQFASLEAMGLWRSVSLRQAALLMQIAQAQETQTPADAENSYRRALLLRQASDDSSTLGETYLGLGRALAAQERWDQAADAFEQADAQLPQDARELRREMWTLYAAALEHIGTVAAGEARWQDADAALRRAAQIQDALDARAASGANWHRLAQNAVAQELWHDAADANQEALARLDMPEAADLRRAVLNQQAQILGHIGQEQQSAGALADASETYRRALAIAQEQGDLATLAELYTLLASLAEAQADWDTARAEYHHALDVYQELEQPLEQAATWARLGDMHRRAQQYADAAAAYENARALYHKHAQPMPEGDMLHRLGHVRGDLQDWDGALSWYDQAITLYNQYDARSAKIEIYRSMETALRQAKRRAADLAAATGDEFLDAGDMQNAERAYREALALYAEAEERVLQAQMQNQLGVTLEAQQRLDQALEHYQAARLGFQEQEIPVAEIGVLTNIGDVERQREHWQEAEAAYRHALALNQSQDDDARAAELRNLLALTREAQGDWEGAIDNFEQALLLSRRVGLDTASVEENLQRARRGARLQAQADYERALALARANDDLAEQGELLNTLGLMAAEDQEWDKAFAYYRDAIAVFEELERQADLDAVWRTAQGTVWNNIGDAAQETGAWHDADTAYARALGFAREFDDRESEALILANLGKAAQQLRDLPRALDLNLQALNTYERLGDATPKPELLERIGNLQLQLEQTDAAEQTFREALDLARAADDRERRARLLKQLGSLAEGRGADEQALAYYDEALTLARELAQAHDEKILLHRQGNLYARRAEWDKAEAAHQAALALAVAQDDKPLQAEIAAQMGSTAAQRGAWDMALAHHQAALALYQEFKEPPAQAALHQRIGQAHAALGAHQDAEAAYLAALEIAKTHATALDPTALRRELAQLAERDHRWQDAANYYAQVRDSLAPDAPPEMLIELDLQRGDAALNVPDYETALACYEEALEHAHASNDRMRVGFALERLGLLAQSKREWDEALANFQEAIEIQREIGQPLGEARLLNKIARLKLEMQNASEADLFAQAALAIAQAFASAEESARSLYLRALAALETQELDLAERFLTQAIAAHPGNSAAQLQLGNTLLAAGRVAEAKQQAEAGRGQSALWELGAQAQLTIAALYADETRTFRQHLKRTRALLAANAEQHRVESDFVRAVEWIVRALEGNAENTIRALEQARQEPAVPSALDAYQFARTALLALAKSPRRFKGKPALVTYLTPPKPRSRRGSRRKDESAPQAAEAEQTPEQIEVETSAEAEQSLQAESATSDDATDASPPTTPPAGARAPDESPA